MKKLIVTITVLATSVFTYAQNVVVLKNGERANGKVTSMSNDVLNVKLKNGETKNYKVEEISLVYFDENLASKAVETKSNLPSGTVTADVPGRKITKSPTMNILTQDKGVVVVNVVVDKYGRVIKAEPGGEGTNTTSQYLMTKAKQTAEATIFDSQPTYPLETKGTITVVF